MIDNNQIINADLYQEQTQAALNILNKQKQANIKLYKNIIDLEKFALNAPVSKEYYQKCKFFCNYSKNYYFNNICKINDIKNIIEFDSNIVKRANIYIDKKVLKRIKLNRTFNRSKYIAFGIITAINITNIANIIRNLKYYGVGRLILSSAIFTFFLLAIKINLDIDNKHQLLLNHLEDNIKKDLFKKLK